MISDDVLAMAYALEDDDKVLAMMIRCWLS
jgi:hypothetical protein